MKKLLALSLALVMALGMTSVAFATEAAYVISPTGYRTTDGVVDDVTSTKAVPANTTAVPGWSVYYQIFKTDGTTGLIDADQVKGATIKQTWDMGKEYIESVSIVKKKLSSNSTYYYFLCVTYKASTSTSTYDVSGEVTVKKSTTTTSSGATTGEPFAATLALNTGYTFAKASSLAIANETTQLYDFAKSGEIAKANLTAAKDAAVEACTLAGTYASYAALVTAAADVAVNDADDDLVIVNDYITAHSIAASVIEGEQTFTTPGGHYFDVDVTGQSKILLYVDQKYNASVAAVYPEANLDFVNFNGASFNKTGELTILADAGSYLYALNADGSLSTVKSTYDEYEEAFKLTTRTLGKYVISDTELKLVAASSSVASSSAVTSSTTTPVKTNPGTGAAA